MAFKNLGLHLSALFWVKSTFKRSSGCYKSNYENKNNLLCNLAFSATRAAFLALKILKLKNNEICKSNSPNEATNMKKLRNFGFVDSLAYDLAFTTFVGLLWFFWNPWYLRRPVVCKNVVSKHYNLKNNFQIRFGISVHCVAWRKFVKTYHATLLLS